MNPVRHIACRADNEGIAVATTGKMALIRGRFLWNMSPLRPEMERFMQFRVLAAATALLSVMAMPAFAEGDPVKGAKVFKKCKACHVVEEEKNRVGPHLVGIIDRPVASVDGFKYSKAMIEFGADGKVWDVETLTIYLKKPKDLIKKTSMAFAGLKKDADIENVVVYLQDPSAAE